MKYVALIILLLLNINTNEYATQPYETQPPIPTPQQQTTGITRYWSDKYASNSQGYCPYANSYGWNNNLSWPTDNHTIRNNRHFTTHHEGIDIDAPENTPVYASQSGVISWNGMSQFGGGYIIIITHGNGWFTLFAHLNESLVQCGQEITQGQQIGLSGQTGTSFPHLHFAVHNGDLAYDPMLWLHVDLP